MRRRRLKAEKGARVDWEKSCVEKISTKKKVKKGEKKDFLKIKVRSSKMESVALHNSTSWIAFRREESAESYCALSEAVAVASFHSISFYRLHNSYEIISCSLALSRI